MMATTLVNTYATKYVFINKDFMETGCQNLEIKSKRLIKSKQIQRFNDRAVKLITHAIYLTLTISTQTKNLAFLLIIKLKNHLMISGQL